ncbi:MAG: hypothetical protein AAF438_00105 [Pseudomonadota bacterium]
MKRILLAILCCATQGCANNWVQISVEFKTKDRRSTEQIEVRYTNDTGSTVCLLPEHWPNQAGKINQTKAVFLIVSGERFPIEYFNTGYCPDCKLIVQPDETVTSSISYDDFQLPAKLRDQPKNLELPSVAFSCPHKP